MPPESNDADAAVPPTDVIKLTGRGDVRAVECAKNVCLKKASASIKVDEVDFVWATE